MIAASAALSFLSAFFALSSFRCARLRAAGVLACLSAFFAFLTAFSSLATFAVAAVCFASAALYAVALVVQLLVTCGVQEDCSEVSWVM